MVWSKKLWLPVVPCFYTLLSEYNSQGYLGFLSPLCVWPRFIQLLQQDWRNRGSGESWQQSPSLTPNYQFYFKLGKIATLHYTFNFQWYLVVCCFASTTLSQYFLFVDTVEPVCKFCFFELVVTINVFGRIAVVSIQFVVTGSGAVAGPHPWWAVLHRWQCGGQWALERRAALTSPEREQGAHGWSAWNMKKIKGWTEEQ